MGPAIRVVAWVIVCVAISTSSLGWAAPAPVVAPPGPGQAALAVGFQAGQLRAATCPRLPCSHEQGQPIALPSEASNLVGAATLELLNLGQGRHAVWLVMPDLARARAYEVVLAASLSGGPVKVVFEGFTGLTSGEDGARQGPMVYVSEPTAKGERRVVIGKQYEAISLCGRPTVLAPNLLNPADLALHPAKVQRLSPSERARAARLKAVRLDGAARMGPPVLRAVGASSGIGAPQNLTDGDLSTSWAENRGGDGKGEFVKLNAPPELPIMGFDFVLRPSGESPNPQVASPREFWLATPEHLMLVSVPEDAARTPGAVFRVMLEEPLRTDCVSLVIESADRDAPDMQVTVAEITAVSEFDPSDLRGLVGALAGGGERAEAAKAMLMAGGPAAFQAVADAYRDLDEGGRRVALDVMDQADCELATPTYVRALLSRYKAHAIHARDRLRRCGRKSADHLVKTLRIARPRAWPILANELGLIAPDRAVLEIAPLLDDDAQARRRLLRIALARAVVDPDAKQAVEQVLTDPKLSDRARLDVMRALGPALADFGSASLKAFAELSRRNDFRTRFLLLGPAASLSSVDATARNYLSRALTGDDNQHMRHGAAVAAGAVAQMTEELVRATSDPAVRVRKAAVEALGERRADAAKAALVERLSADRWPMVRSAAADALGGLGPSPELDRALGQALDDSSPFVRAPVARALGRRRAYAFAPQLRKHLEDDDEVPRVRAAAARALGRLCDRQSLELLTELGVKRADPLLDEPKKNLSMAALEALAALGPPDLRERLKPLFSPHAAPGARAAAERVLGTEPSCAGR